jgi:glycosyltransferase involved in cell wall biosynthesis
MIADIIHISGFDSYNTHDSGNYIVFDFLRSLKYDSKMILALGKTKQDKDTFLIRKEKILDSIKEAKIVILHDSLFTHEEIKQLHNKLDCQIIMITQDHSLIATHDCKGNLSYPELNDKETQRYNNPLILERKRIFKNLPITIVHGSTHSKRIFEQSPIYSDKEFSFIPLPADVPFCSSPKQKAREYLGLKKDFKYILWGTTQPKTERKGKKIFDDCLDILWDNLKEAERKKIIIINVGPNAGKFGNTSSFTTIHFGYQRTRKDMSVFYRASTISVCTTTSDAGPMMISESMCNETPVVAFDRSISCDLCVDNQTGYLIKDLNKEQMANRIHKILFFDDLQIISEKSRKKYLSFHDKDVILNKWNNLFVKLLEKK